MKEAFGEVRIHRPEDARPRDPDHVGDHGDRNGGKGEENGRNALTTEDISLTGDPRFGRNRETGAIIPRTGIGSGSRWQEKSIS